jgi:hypothetical protein
MHAWRSALSVLVPGDVNVIGTAKASVDLVVVGLASWPACLPTAVGSAVTAPPSPRGVALHAPNRKPPWFWFIKHAGPSSAYGAAPPPREFRPQNFASSAMAKSVIRDMGSEVEASQLVQPKRLAAEGRS